MPTENEPVDIFDTDGTSAPEEEEVLDGDEEEEEEDDESGEEGDDEEDGDEEGDDDEDDDEGGDDDEEDADKTEIARLNGLLKTKNNALRDMRKANRTNKVSAAEFKPVYPADELRKFADLPKEEQEEMTDREKKMHDDSVVMKERFNKDAKDKFDAEEADKAENIDPDALDEDETEDFVKASAKFLAKGDKKIANQIIRKFNLFKTEGFSEEKIEEALGEAARLVKGFKPARESAGRKGKAVKKTKGKGATGTDAIIKSLDSTETKKAIEL